MSFGAMVTQVDVVESTSPATLQGKIAASFASQLLAHPVTQLIDVYLAGGGAGGVFQVTILYSTLEDTHFPPLVDQHVKVFQAPDPLTMKGKIATFLADPTTDRITFNDKQAAGAGALWVDLLVYTVLIRAPALVSEAVTTPAAEAAATVAPVPVATSNARAAAIRRARKG